MNQQLSEYVRKAREQGMADGEIKKNLLGAGWREKDVNEAMGQGNVAPSSFAEATPLTAGPVARKTASNILGESLKVYKENFKIFFIIALIPAILLSAATILDSFSGSDPEKNVNTAYWGTGLGIVALVLVVVGLVFQFLSQIALVYAIKHKAEHLGVKESYRRAYKIAIPFIWISILTSFVVMGGYLLLIIPGIIFSFQLAFGTYVLIVEGDRGVNALLKSKEYTKGRLGDLFVRLFVLGLAAGAVIYLPLILLGLIKLPDYAIRAISSILTALVLPYAAVYLYLTYENFRDTHGQISTPPPARGKMIGWAVWGGVAIPLLIVAVIALIGLGAAREKNKEAQFNSGPPKIHKDFF